MNRRDLDDDELARAFLEVPVVRWARKGLVKSGDRLIVDFSETTTVRLRRYSPTVVFGQL